MPPQLQLPTPRRLAAAAPVPFELQCKILGRLLVGTLVANQVLKAFGSSERNDSLLDSALRVLGSLSPIDWAVLASTLCVAVVLLLRRWPKAPSSEAAEVVDGQLMTLPAGRMDEAAAVAAAAFARADASVWQSVCGGARTLEQREGLLRWVFERNFRLRAGTSANRAVLRGGRVVCCFMFVTPDVPQVTLLDMVRVGLAEMPFRFGVATVRRMLTAKEKAEAQMRALEEELGLTRANTCMLERVVVAPFCQGQGVGTAALQPVLGEADERGWTTLLATNEERNVRFYERLGFETVREEEQRVGDEPPVQTWLMARRPAKGSQKEESLPR